MIIYWVNEKQSYYLDDRDWKWQVGVYDTK